MRGKILAIAGSDSGAGAGIQADLKTANNLGFYLTTAITALTAQNSQTVSEILPIPANFITKQIETVTEDIKIDAIKIGMVYDVTALKAIHKILSINLPRIPIIFDPVMVATSGAKLNSQEEKFIKYLKNTFLKFTHIVTPNIPEAETICNIKINNLDDMVIAAQMIQKMGAKNVLIKGGHIDDKIIYDVLLTNKTLKIFETKKINTENTHGSGCTLATAISCGVAAKLDIIDTIKMARQYVNNAITNSIKPGKGPGTLNFKE